MSGRVAAAVAEATGRAVRELRPVGGGDVNDAYAIVLDDRGEAVERIARRLAG